MPVPFYSIFLFPVEIQSGISVLQGLQLLQTFCGSGPSWTPHSLHCWDIHACSVENVLLISFTVTSCVCSRKHHLHISHGNGICLSKRMWITSPHAFLFSFLLSLFFILIFRYPNYFNKDSIM